MSDPWFYSASGSPDHGQAGGGRQPQVPPQFQKSVQRTPAQPQFQPYRQPQTLRQPARQQLPVKQQAPYPLPQGYRPVQTARKMSLTPAELFWYVLMNVSFGAGYFAKVPAKKALSDFGMAEMTAAEKFWYVLMCIPFGAGYFAKIPTAKAIEDMLRQPFNAGVPGSPPWPR